MKGNNSLMDWVVKLIFLLMLGPFLISLLLHTVSAMFHIIWAFLVASLLWIICLALLIGVVSGGIAGLIIRGRLPRRNRDYLPPGEVPPVKRPRGPGRDDND